MNKIELLQNASGKYMVHNKHGSSTQEGCDIRDLLLRMEDNGLIVIRGRSLGITSYSITPYGEKVLSESDV